MIHSFPRKTLLAFACAALLGLGQAAAQPGDHTLNIRDADIRAFIETVSEITGKNFIVDPRVEGKVNVISKKPMTEEEVYDVFESVLRVHGFAAIPSGNMIKILPEVMAKQDGTPTSDVPGPDTMVTHVVELKHVSAAELLPVLNQLVPQSGQVTVHQGSNSLIISDRYGNLTRIEQLIRRIDTASDTAVEVIPLQHANAAELARTLTVLADDKSAAANATAPPKVFADTRTNSILLSGDKSARLRVRTLIAHLDTPLESGESTQVVYLRYVKAADMVALLETTAATLTGSSGAKEEAKVATIQAHEETNSLVISAAPAVYRTLTAVIRQLDVRRAQVLIEGVIAELGDEFAQEIGVQWQSTNLDDDGDGTLEPGEEGVIGGTNFPGPGGVGGIFGAAVNPASVGSGLNIGYIGGTITLPGSDEPILQIGALVRALKGDGKSNILSQPSIVTLDHQEAEIKVGQEVPFLTGQYSNLTNSGGATPVNPFQTVERKDVGIKLLVTPHVNEGDAVRLDISQEVSSLAPNVQGASDLITNKREIKTSVLVSDGAMLVLGGLIQEDVRENVSKVPALGDIPVLGNLFRYRNTTRRRSDLMIFLKPTILRDAALEAAVSSDKYNFIRMRQLDARERPGMIKPNNNQPLLPEQPWTTPMLVPQDVPSQPADRGSN